MKVGILVECGRDGLEDVVVRRICDLLRANAGEPVEIDIVTMDNKENLIRECGPAVAGLLGDGCDRVVILWDERPGMARTGRTAVLAQRPTGHSRQSSRGRRGPARCPSGLHRAGVRIVAALRRADATWRVVPGGTSQTAGLAAAASGQGQEPQGRDEGLIRPTWPSLQRCSARTPVRSSPGRPFAPEAMRDVSEVCRACNRASTVRWAESRLHRPRVPRVGGAHD